MTDNWPTSDRFSRTDGAVPALFELRQIADDEFKLLTPFRYQGRDGRYLEINDREMTTTDLASVPWFMAWFVSNYGRHTPAVLVHDQLTPDHPTPDANIRRREADRMFLEAMDDLDVAPVRSRVMWAAVVFATKWANWPLGTLSMLAWLACSLAGTGLLAVSIAAGSPLALLALVGPFAGALLWGRCRAGYWAGVAAGYGLWLTLPPALVSVAVHYLAYWPAEWIVRRVRRRLRHNRGRDLPGPLSYNKA